MAATAPLPDLNIATGAAVAPVNLDSYFKDPDASSDLAIFDTTLGTIPVLLTPRTTPATVANFESYVSKGAYTDTIVHRLVPGFIWQSGGYQLTSTQSIAATPTAAPVQNEFGASNVRGTIAMAKLGNDPNSATSQFFFNESDSNAANLDNQNGGFTVFGHVVGAAGLAVMDAIAAVPVPSPGPLASPLDSAPLQNYMPGAAVQPSNLILIKGVTMASEAFSASSDAPGVATASVQGSTLTVSPVAPGTAHLTVLGYGSDGNAATETFTVNVAQGSQPASPAAAQPVAAPASVLTLTTRGTLPASAIAGQKAKIQQAVTLTATSGPVTQAERVAISLSPTTTGSAGDVTIASAAKQVKLKAGSQARLSLSARQLDANVPPGTYHVLVSVTDPDGSKTTVDTGKTLIVHAPRAKPSTK
jgi:cyclophilin family peptidyl-prolyl cis-trans isomerase